MKTSHSPSCIPRALFTVSPPGIVAIFFATMPFFLFSCISNTNLELAVRYYNIATEYYADKDYEKAVNYYGLALSQDSSLKIAHLNYGLALIEVEDFKEAEVQLLEAQSIDERNTLSLSALAYLSFRNNKYEEAAARYRNAVKINQYNPETFYNLGIVEQQLKRYQTSQEAFAQVHELQKVTERPKELRRLEALNHLYLGDEEKAMTLYNEYFSDQGSSEEVYQDAYSYFFEQKEYNKVVEIFAEFAKSIRNSPWESYLLANLYYLTLNNPVLGLKHLKAAINRRFLDEEKLAALVKQLRSSDRTTAKKLLDSKK